MAALILKNLSKVYASGAVAVRNLDIEVLEGELMVLVGPSGSGKSTTLRLIAGLESPTEGDIFIAGKRANDIAPRDRDIAMVFQDYALYPHFNVAQNLGFGLTMRGVPKADVRSRVADAAVMLGISDLLDRKPKELSGGQRQRVALGRALVRNPRVFLFDEPLSNLDAALRLQLRQEIRQLHRKLGATMVYVTHDQGEAMTMGDHIAVMNNGSLEQVGAPSDLYRKPATKFVAGFLGSPSINSVECEAKADAGALEIVCGDFTFALRPCGSKELGDIPPKLFLGFRPEDVHINEGSEAGSLSGSALVVSVEATGAETLVHLEDGSLKFTARILGYADIVPESQVRYSIPASKLHLFDAHTGKRIDM